MTAKDGGGRTTLKGLADKPATITEIERALRDTEGIHTVQGTARKKIRKLRRRGSGTSLKCVGSASRAGAQPRRPHLRPRANRPQSRCPSQPAAKSKAPSKKSGGAP